MKKLLVIIFLLMSFNLFAEDLCLGENKAAYAGQTWDDLLLVQQQNVVTVCLLTMMSQAFRIEDYDLFYDIYSLKGKDLDRIRETISEMYAGGGEVRDASIGDLIVYVTMKYIAGH